MARSPRICATCGVEYEQDTLFCPKDGTPLGSSRNEPGEDPYVGQVLGEQIEIRQLVGIGSMGRVYRAWQKGVERDVAVKLLHRELSANSTVVGRFLREARIASKLQHPNVVQVLMAGQRPAGSAGVPVGNELYIVMEYLDGISLLSALAAAGGALPLPRALHLVLQICDAVGEAHAQGIVHRDLKPENVVLVRRGDDADFVKVLDFGIARLDWSAGSVATQAGLIFGTARYISPEGSRGETVGPTADVYSIATMLYQSLSGRTPFENDSPMALLMMHTYEQPPPITSIPRAAYLPGPLASVIMRNLDKLAERRAPNARALGRDLVDAARASGLSPDDLVPRSTLLGQRVTSAAAFTSIERTKQHQLSARAASIIGAHSAAGQSGAGDDTDAAQPAAAPQGADDARQMSSSPAGVEPVVPKRMSTPPVDSPAVQAPQAAAHGTSPTLDAHEAPRASVPSRHGRAIVIVLACLVGGSGLVSLAAHRLGYLRTASAQTASDFTRRAEEALRERRWSAPPGDNVRDLTAEGLRRFPGDASLLDVRRRAAQEMVSSSLGKKYAGDMAGAMADAKLARELGPENTTAQHLVQELAGLMDGGRAAFPAEPTDALVPDASADARPTGGSQRLPDPGGSAKPPASREEERAPTDARGRPL